ncbi:hypothetical protein FGRMN_9399 [Fusarium graminum]|nr:hypothetical protein FGRMN_9399 [Fusarium graminum]
MAEITDKWVAHLSAQERADSQNKEPKDCISKSDESSCSSGPSTCIGRPSSQDKGICRSRSRRTEVSLTKYERWPHQNGSGRQLWHLDDTSRSTMKQNATPPSSPPSEHDASSKMMRQPETRPISQEQLVEEVKGIYAGLVMIENKCKEVVKSTSTLNNEQWQALIALHRTLLHGNHDYFPLREHRSKAVAGKALCPKYSPLNSLPTKLPAHQDLRQASIRDRLREFSLKSRTWRRLNDRLVPMLRREQDLESSQQWVQVVKLTSSLLELLDENNSMLDDANAAFLEAFAQVEAILHRFKLRFRRRYHELLQKNGPTELVFEFPNNIRHICTTMPWTIAPALLILWGVCWMFIASHSSSHERPAIGSVVSPQPTLYDFSNDFQNTCIGDDDLGYSDPLFHSFDFLQASPVDPDFLALDTSAYTGTSDLLAPLRDADEICQLSEVTIPNPVQQTYPTLGQQPSSSVSDNRSHCMAQQNKTRFPCPDCRNIVGSQEEREPSLTISITTPTSRDEIPSLQANSAEASGSHSTRKRARSEDDEDKTGEGGLLDEMKRKYKRMLEEFKKREERYLREQRGYLQARGDLELMARIMRDLEDAPLGP